MRRHGPRAAIERLLDEYGVVDESLLPYLDAALVEALAACLKPAPRALFKQSVRALQAAAAADAAHNDDET